MLAVRLHRAGDGPRVEEVPTPDPSGTEVRIRVAGAGVCRTDLHIVDGIQRRVSLPVTLGHEVAGWLDAAAADAAPILRRDGLREGDAVVVSGGWGCGECRECLAGAEQRCPASRSPGFQADGGYAEAMLVPHPRHVVPIGSLDPVRAAPLADAGITAYRAVRRAERWLGEGARVVQIGCGGVGQFALQFLRALPAAGGLRIAVCELDARRVERARMLGAAGLLDPDARAVHDALGAAADVVLDLVGSDRTLALAAEAVAPDGVVLLVGETGGSLPFGFDGGPPVESWLTTVAWGSAANLRDVVALARGAAVDWAVETMPLAEAGAAHERLRAGGVDGRLVLVP